MIQRIQTIFLLLSAGALGGLFALPLATSATKAAAGIFQDGIFNIQDDLIMMIITGLAILIAVIAIFLFKNRYSSFIL